MNTLITEKTLASQIIDALHSVVGYGQALLHEPCFVGNEWIYLKECLDSTYVSSVGQFVDRFEAELAAYTGAKYAVAVMNGTAALHLSLLLAGVQRDDEVIVPALSFVATANAVKYCGAMPHFADSEERTLGLDPSALREHLMHIADIQQGQCINRFTGRVIRALVPMHTFGHPVDMECILQLARDFHLVVIEDAAESLGSYYQGQHTGTFGLMGTLSFNGNKTITTGGGGAIITNDAILAKRAKHLSTTAKLPNRWEFVHDEVGYNYRMPNINAALGCAQLELLPKFILAQRGLFERYQQAFSHLTGVALVKEPEKCHSNYWLQTVLLDNLHQDQRDQILQETNDAVLMTRPAWILLHKLAPYRDCPRMLLSVAESLEQRLINIPSGVKLKKADLS